MHSGLLVELGALVLTVKQEAGCFFVGPAASYSNVRPTHIDNVNNWWTPWFTPRRCGLIVETGEITSNDIVHSTQVWVDWSRIKGWLSATKPIYVSLPSCSAPGQMNGSENASLSTVLTSQHLAKR